MQPLAEQLGWFLQPRCRRCCVWFFGGWKVGMGCLYKLNQGTGDGPREDESGIHHESAPAEMGSSPMPCHSSAWDPSRQCPRWECPLADAFGASTGSIWDYHALSRPWIGLREHLQENSSHFMRKSMVSGEDFPKKTQPKIFPVIFYRKISGLQGYPQSSPLL